VLGRLAPTGAEHAVEDESAAGGQQGSADDEAGAVRAEGARWDVNSAIPAGVPGFGTTVWVFPLFSAHEKPLSARPIRIHNLRRDSPIGVLIQDMRKVRQRVNKPGADFP
jgi:hypothetical protein